MYFSVTKKIRRIQSYPQLRQQSNNLPIRKIKSMSTMKLLPVQSSHLPHIITNKVIPREKSTPTVKEKQISFEVKTNSYNRKVEVKTKQEEKICTTKKSESLKSPPIVTRVVKTETPISSQRITMSPQRRISSMYSVTSIIPYFSYARRLFFDYFRFQ